MFLMPFNCTVEKDEIKAKRIAAPCSKQRAPRICQPTTTRELITNSASHTPSPAEVGPTCQPQEALFFFLSSLAFFPFSIGGTKARAITSQHGKQKNTHKFTGNSLQRQSKFLGKRWRTKKPPPDRIRARIGSGRRRRRRQDRSCAAPVECGGGRGGGGLVGSWRGEERGREFHEILFSPLLFLSRLLFPA